MFAYWGKILRVNLSSGSVTTEALSEDLMKRFLGGRGLGTKLYMDEVAADIDPLSPENKLLFVTGPLTGTATPTGGRYMVVTKSPLTSTIASSNSGGFWGAELKFAGYDVIILEGKAAKPVYLKIIDDVVTLEDASHVWGKKVSEATDILAAAAPEKARIAMIGPAGENLSYIAAIINDKRRAAGRSGVGAVMGSKNLKAIVVKGSKKPEIPDAAVLKTLTTEKIGKLKENGVTGTGLPAYGTAVLVNIINELGVLPTNNFQTGNFADAEDISGETMAEKYLVSKYACFRCPIGCGRNVKLDNEELGGPEYETIWSYGSDCGIKDYREIIKANHMCDEMGIDTISAGSTIAAAMELYQKGLIKDADLNGISLKFGDASSIVEWTERMGNRTGLGDLMADGSYRLCENFGVPELSMSVKKQELPAYDPRGIQGMGLSYATSNRGGCHVRGYMISPEVLGLPELLDRFATEGKDVWTKIFQDLTAFIDSAGLCLFTSFALGPQDYAELLNGVTGWSLTADDVLQIGERIYNLEKIYNLKAGLTAADDTLPNRLLEDAIPSGPSEGKVNLLSEMLPKYYQARGWDEKGVPTAGKMSELGL